MTTWKTISLFFLLLLGLVHGQSSPNIYIDRVEFPAQFDVLRNNDFNVFVGNNETTSKAFKIDVYCFDSAGTEVEHVGAPNTNVAAQTTAKIQVIFPLPPPSPFSPETTYPCRVDAVVGATTKTTTVFINAHQKPQTTVPEIPNGFVLGLGGLIVAIIFLIRKNEE